MVQNLRSREDYLVAPALVDDVKELTKEATIPEPREDFQRVVNSIQITKAGNLECSPLTKQERRKFLTDDALGIQYGQPELRR